MKGEVFGWRWEKERFGGGRGRVRGGLAQRRTTTFSDPGQPLGNATGDWQNVAKLKRPARGKKPYNHSIIIYWFLGFFGGGRHAWLTLISLTSRSTTTFQLVPLPCCTSINDVDVPSASPSSSHGEFCHWRWMSSAQQAFKVPEAVFLPTFRNGKNSTAMHPFFTNIILHGGEFLIRRVISQWLLSLDSTLRFLHVCGKFAPIFLPTLHSDDGKSHQQWRWFFVGGFCLFLMRGEENMLNFQVLILGKRNESVNIVQQQILLINSTRYQREKNEAKLHSL